MTIRTIQYDDKVIHRARSYRFFDGYFKDLIADFTLINPVELERILKESFYAKALPEDFFINSIHRSPTYSGFTLVITSKDFEEISEYSIIPEYVFELFKNEDGTIDATSKKVIEN